MNKHSQQSFNFQDSNIDNWNELTEWIKTELLPKGVNLPFSEQTIQILLQIINRILDKFMWYNCLDLEVAETLTETVKVFRLYVTNEKVAKYLIHKDDFLDMLEKLTMRLFTKRNGPELYTKYLLQFFINFLCMVNSSEKTYIKQTFFKHSLTGMFHAMFCNEYGYLYETSAILYNLYCHVELEDDNIIAHILKFRADHNKCNEYLNFLVQKIMTQDYIWQHFNNLSKYSRLEVLYCMQEILISQDVGNLEKVLEIPTSCLQCFVDIFNSCSNVVFQVNNQDHNISIEEVSSILQLLAHLSSCEKYFTFLQNKDVLINAGVLLINAHRLGKTSNNVFTAIQKLSELQNPKEQIKRNPVFGFKADLVRLIGNLCWKNKKMQDLAREGELIPVLLDSCNIDANNPFIIQWVILAIRNICENNKENQAVIAGLAQQGVVSSEVLQEFGLELHSEGDLNMGIMRLDINKT